MNYFELFGLPVSLQIDSSQLAKKYFELQKQSHPDYFTQSTEAEQEEALEKSSTINKALKIFKDKDSTIKYLLQLKGLLEEDEKYQLPPAFLMEVMELNEELTADSGEVIHGLEQEMYAAVQPLIEHYDDGKVTTKELLQIKEYYFKKKYLQRILDRLDD